MSESESAATSTGKTKTAAPKTIFVISPIGPTGTAEHRRYRNTLEYIVKKAFHAPDYVVVRADEETSPDSITTQVIGRIVESDLIIADLTDHNPNVFYELAVAHGYQKPVIHMMQSGQKVPFDVVDQRVIFYDLTDPESVDKARSGLINSAAWLDENPGQTRNPLSAYGQFSAISNASGGGEAGEAVASAIETLSRQVARLENRLPKREPLFVAPRKRNDSMATQGAIANLLGVSSFHSTEDSAGILTMTVDKAAEKMNSEMIDAIAVAAQERGWEPEIEVKSDGRVHIVLRTAR